MEPPNGILSIHTLNFFTEVIIKPFSPFSVITIVLSGILLFMSGVISAAETAFFSLNPSEHEEVKHSAQRSDRIINELLNRQKRLLATLLIGLNFMNIGIVLLSTYFFSAQFDFSSSPILGFVIQVVIVTFLILVVAEIIPKMYATKNPLGTARMLSFPVYILEKIFYPVASMLIFSTSIIDKRLKKKAPNISVDELSHALELTKDDNILSEDKQILRGILKFGNIDVKQIMKPRMVVIAFEYKTPYQELLKSILHSGFSRIPVFKENLDKISGVLYIKDLLPYLDKSNDFNWQGLLRPSFFVPENKKIDDLLREFQFKKIHLAIVVDEYGGTSGIVTLEDVIEEVIGEINDEFDDDDIVYSKLDENNFVFEGGILLNDLYRIIEMDGTPFEEAKSESDTLAGFLLELTGKIPQKNENINFGNITFRVESVDSRKIKRVKVIIDRNNNENNTGPNA